VKSAEFAQQAGFDGVQIHAAHGYLIHQFLMKSVNHRCDLFRDGKHFLELILLGIQKRCGDRFPVLVKVSGSAGSGFTDLIRFLDSQPVAAIEISYGTMDAALNIMRGDVPDELVLKYNPVLKAKGRLDRWFKRTLLFPVLKSTLAPFTPAYNLIYAKIAKRHTTLPIICVGGIRKGSEMKTLVETEGIDFVGLCRPFICEPDFAVKLRRNENAVSRCVNCNGCTIMCDSGLPTRCYRQERTHDTGTKSNKLIC
jgi:2,4-dienoyl-CoA reductase-like NADH-dependent reductase (Old Yellow Enzyme family)